jgi:hypothetical protein
MRKVSLRVCTNSTSDGPELIYQEWDWPKNIDLVISLGGVYVALIGIKASNKNTLRLVKQYMWGTVGVGIAWMIYNYFMSVEIDMAVEEEHEKRDDDMFPDLSDKDIYNQAISVMVLPGMLWFLCCVRAFQFQSLLREAEREAEERIQRDLDLGESSAPETINITTVEHDEELAIQNESATII